MIFRELLLFSTLLVFSQHLFGQRLVTGRIRDFHSKKPVDSVDVAVYKGTSVTMTNGHGYFQMTVDANDSLLITHPNYKIGLIPVPKVDVFNVFIESADEYPTYLDGDAILFSFLQQNLVYPGRAISKSIEGILFIEVQVDSSGSPITCKALNEIGGNCAKRTLEVFNSIPGKWSVSFERKSFIFPVVFKLDGKSKEIDLPKIQLPQARIMESIYVASF